MLRWVTLAGARLSWVQLWWERGENMGTVSPKTFYRGSQGTLVFGEGENYRGWQCCGQVG